MNPNLLRNGIICLAILLVPAAARATADTTPPVLVSFAFAPGSVDVTATAQNISVTAQATDNSSGISDIYCVFKSPSGSTTFAVECDYLVSGTPLNGVYTGLASLDTCKEAGTWTLESIIVTDQCGNTEYYAAVASGSTPAFPPGTVKTFTVINTNPAPPATPLPVVTSFTYTPSSVTLPTTNSITVTLSGSNISSADVAFQSPSGIQSVYGSLTGSGPGTSGAFTATISGDEFTTCSEPGTWTLEYLYVYDYSLATCGTSGVLYYNASKPPPGAPETTLSITNPGADLTPPALTSLVLTSTTADVTNGDATVYATIGASDNSSGVSYGYGIYTSSSGSLEISFSNETGTVVLNGTFQGIISLANCTVPGIYALASFSVYDVCGNVQEYGGSNAAFPAGILPSSIQVINGTISTGSVGVEVYPAAAADDGGYWYLDSGSNNLEFSGQVVAGVAPGLHTINFLGGVSGYTTPASQNLMAVANQTVWTSGTYISTTPSDSVQVNIVPAGAVTAGAQWDVDGGELEPSGATVSALTDGTHVIDFSDVDGYTAPPSQTVTTASNQTTVTTGTYAVITGSGSLTVTLAPPGAITAGAQWNVDGGSSESTGATVSGLVAGDHTVNFLGGGTAFSPPAAQTVLINASETTTTTGTYTALTTGTGSLKVTILPSAAVSAGAEWNLEGGASQKSGSTLTGISAGGYTVNFTMINGYVTPASQSVTIVPDETLVTSGTYATAPPFVGAAESFVGISPKGLGLLTLSLKDTGKFTGKLMTAGARTYSFAGAFPATGYFTGETGKPPVPYVLQITGSSPSTYLLTGSANGVQITAYPAAVTTETGTYTALLTSTGASAAIPQGTGYATLKVKTTGAGSITGKLADGTGFSASSIVVAGTSGNELIVFDPNLYARKGLVSGVLFFGAPAVGEFDGSLAWVKPFHPGSYYAAGFATTLDAAGALYEKTTAVPFTSGTLTFSGGGLGSPVTQLFNVTGTGGVTLVAPITDDAKLTIKTSTGAVSGSFKPDGKEIKFKGMLLQDPNDFRAAGYFLGPVVSGSGLSGNVTLP